jgi:hypothetical protein
MHRLSFVLLFTFTVLNVFGQKLNKNLNKDSLAQVLFKKLPAAKQQEFQKAYKEGSEVEQEFLLYVANMPRSSKEEQIRNIDSNFAKIDELRTAYKKLVPANHSIYVEFNPKDEVFEIKETVTIKAFKKDNQGTTPLFSEWDLDYNDKKLDEILKSLSWDKKTLSTIQLLLSAAKCISIENGEITSIGFARSGLGKYYYKLFNKDLTTEEAEKYNDGCRYIFYKKNIVFEYGSGAVGSLCFPD